MIEMFLSTFVILGPRVQNVGYRPFLVGKFQNFDLQGKVWNDSTSLAVEVEVYGRKRNIEDGVRNQNRKDIGVVILQLKGLCMR